MIEQTISYIDHNGKPCNEKRYLNMRIKEGVESMSDGTYIELFVVKDGVRYNAKILDMRDAALTLTNGLMNGI